ncbi:hypothetical protein ACIHFE_25030 [Streptomyces sp. NPDC052396]|uniref:hypothetical protein n=1 Tax=Streptomyces sp. NPDC052396 TaxID=3365689 RepID=UPI0037D54CF5
MDEVEYFAQIAAEPVEGVHDDGGRMLSHPPVGGVQRIGLLTPGQGDPLEGVRPAALLHRTVVRLFAGRLGSLSDPATRILGCAVGPLG